MTDDNPTPTVARPRKVEASGFGAVLAAIANVVTIAAGAIAVAGIWVWIDEKDDREEERVARQEERTVRAADAEVRRMTLIGAAQAMLREEASDGYFYSMASPNIQWAFRILQENGTPIDIVADKVELFQVDLTCAVVRIKSSSVVFEESRSRNSVLELTTDSARFDTSGVAGTELIIKPYSSATPMISYEASAVSDTRHDIGQFRTGVSGYSFEGGSPHAVRFHASRAQKFSANLAGHGTFILDELGPEATFEIPSDDCLDDGTYSHVCPVIGGTDKPGIMLGRTRMQMAFDLAAPECVRPAQTQPSFVIREK